LLVENSYSCGVSATKTSDTGTCLEEREPFCREGAGEFYDKLFPFSFGKLVEAET
jgi:hypothetical protein